jgi:hypothetical protein
VNDPKLGLGLKNSCGGNAHVIIVLKRRPDKPLELLVLEDFPPFLVTERGGRRSAGRGRIR